MHDEDNRRLSWSTCNSPRYSMPLTCDEIKSPPTFTFLSGATVARDGHLIFWKELA
jgi:hypothetical protein